MKSRSSLALSRFFVQLSRGASPSKWTHTMSSLSVCWTSRPTTMSSGANVNGSPAPTACSRRVRSRHVTLRRVASCPVTSRRVAIESHRVAFRSVPLQSVLFRSVTLPHDNDVLAASGHIKYGVVGRQRGECGNVFFLRERHSMRGASE